MGLQLSGVKRANFENKLKPLKVKFIAILTMLLILSKDETIYYIFFLMYQHFIFVSKYSVT